MADGVKTVRPVIVSPDDVVEAYTEDHGDIPVIRFEYKPMTNRQHARYLDKIEKAGKSFEKLQDINLRLLADHVAAVTWPGDVMIDLKNVEAWERVATQVVFDMVSTIAGLGDVAQKEKAEIENL